MSDEKDWVYWLDQIEDNGVNLSTWETDFIESLQAQRAAKHRLSEKQAAILERIYAERTP